MIALKVNLDGLKAKLGRIEQAMPNAQEDAILEIGKVAARELVKASRIDTNEYRRAWALAALDIGVDTGVPLGVWRSQMADVIEDRLEQQLDRLEHAEQRARTLGYDKSKSKASQKVYKKIVRRTIKAFEVLEGYRRSNGRATVVWGREADGDVLAERLSTIREKVYGGDGRIELINGKAIVILTNREAHARIVERKYRVKSRAFAMVRRYGISQAGRSYRKKLREAAA